jgi:hypothetical protein
MKATGGNPSAPRADPRLGGIDLDHIGARIERVLRLLDPT